MGNLLERKADKAFEAGDFLALLRRHAKLFVGVFLGLLLVSILLYIFRIPYVARGRLLVNDSQNSSLQAFSTAYFGMTKSVVDGKKGNTQMGKQIEVLKTRDFYEKLLQRIEERGQSPSLTLEEQRAYQSLKENYLDVFSQEEGLRQEFIRKLDSWSQAKLESDYEIRISFSSPSKGLSLFLTNTTLELASDYLREREMAEILEVEKFILDQKALVDQNIKNLTAELASFQSQPENLISMTSRDKMGEYLSDLMVRMNEARLKISENKKDIDFLLDGRGGEKNLGSSLYGVGGRIEALRLENKLLESRIAQLKDSVDKISRQLQVLPVAAHMLEDKRKKSELEYVKYKELTETLARVEAQKLSVRDRFEILERARPDNTRPQVDLLTLAFLSAVLSLVLGLTMVYLQCLWKPLALSGEEARNVMVYEGNEVPDPMVVLEKANAKFQLGNQKSME